MAREQRELSIVRQPRAISRLLGMCIFVLAGIAGLGYCIGINKIKAGWHGLQAHATKL